MTNLSCTAFLAEHIQNLKIAVIGDVMLDRYFYGEVKRISPEAPVPVNKVKRIKSVLGGAANVAANLAHLECRVFMDLRTSQKDIVSDSSPLCQWVGISVRRNSGNQLEI